jgi:hypothetical protein
MRRMGEGSSQATQSRPPTAATQSVGRTPIARPASRRPGRRVLVQAAEARSTGSASTKRTPSPIVRHAGGAPSRATRGSETAMPASSAPEARNETASASSASGAPTAPTSSPPRLGPATCAAGLAGAEVPVGGEQLLGPGEQHQQRGGGLVEQHRQRAREERDQVEVRRAEDAERDHERHRRHHHGTADVGGDHDQPAARGAVDPATSEQREQGEGVELRRHRPGVRRPRLRRQYAFIRSTSASPNSASSEGVRCMVELENSATSSERADYVRARSDRALRPGTGTPARRRGRVRPGGSPAARAGRPSGSCRRRTGCRRS